MEKIDDYAWRILTRLALMSKRNADGGHALYCVVCAEKFIDRKKMTYDEARKLMFEVFILNGMDKSVLMAVLEATKTHYFSEGFEWGFCGSLEGWNGEYPFHDKNLDPKLDEHYQAILKDGLDNTP